MGLTSQRTIQKLCTCPNQDNKASRTKINFEMNLLNHMVVYCMRKKKRKQYMGKSRLAYSNHGHVSITSRRVLCYKISLYWQICAYVMFSTNTLGCMYLRIIIFRESLVLLIIILIFVIDDTNF